MDAPWPPTGFIVFAVVALVMFIAISAVSICLVRRYRLPAGVTVTTHYQTGGNPTTTCSNSGIQPAYPAAGTGFPAPGPPYPVTGSPYTACGTPNTTNGSQFAVHYPATVTPHPAPGFIYPSESSFPVTEAANAYPRIIATDDNEGTREAPPAYEFTINMVPVATEGQKQDS